MRTLTDETILDWIRNEKRFQDRLNKINKIIKKYQKQKNHFEFRLDVIKKNKKGRARDYH